MLKTIYKIILRPHSNDPDQYSREIVLNWIFTGIIIVLSVYSLNSFANHFFFGKDHMVIRLVIINISLLLAVLYATRLRHKKYAQKFASIIILLGLLASATFIIFQWGIINPFGILLFALSIVVSGILINSRFSIYMFIVISVLFLAYYYAVSYSTLSPDTSWIADTPMTDIINCIALFAVIALISWLFNRQMEASLQRARRSERALKKERDLLEIKVEERTRELQEAQLEKVQQVYKFAELGHLSTALFHDLAGNLSSLSIDIETMRKTGNKDFSRRIDNNVKYIDDVVRRVKSQIRGNDAIETFDMVSEAKDLVGILAYNARKARTCISFDPPAAPIHFTGNLTRFRQLIINLLSNAIEAYPPVSASVSVKDRPVVLKMSETDTHIHISVADFGQGIQKTLKEKIFDPFYSTKSSGSGIGLFIVKQVAESDFSGTITLTSSKKSGTIFSINIPR